MVLSRLTRLHIMLIDRQWATVFSKRGHRLRKTTWIWKCNDWTLHPVMSHHHGPYAGIATARETVRCWLFCSAQAVATC